MDSSSPRCTCFAVRRAARHITQAYDGHLAPTGLRTTQYSLLNALAGAGSVDGSNPGGPDPSGPHPGPGSLLAVARRMGMDRTTLGRNLRPLERDGLVAIEVDPQDRRGRLLTITAAGRDRLAQARLCWIAAQQAFEASYGPAATETLHATLDAVARVDLVS